MSRQSNLSPFALITGFHIFMMLSNMRGPFASTKSMSNAKDAIPASYNGTTIVSVL